MARALLPDSVIQRCIVKPCQGALFSGSGAVGRLDSAALKIEMKDFPIHFLCEKKEKERDLFLPMQHCNTWSSYHLRVYCAVHTNTSVYSMLKWVCTAVSPSNNTVTKRMQVLFISKWTTTSANLLVISPLRGLLALPTPLLPFICVL